MKCRPVPGFHIIIICEGRIEKSIPRDHRLSSLVIKPCDAKRRSLGQIVLSYPHIHDRFLYILYSVIKRFDSILVEK